MSRQSPKRKHQPSGFQVSISAIQSTPLFSRPNKALGQIVTERVVVSQAVISIGDRLHQLLGKFQLAVIFKIKGAINFLARPQDTGFVQISEVKLPPKHLRSVQPISVQQIVGLALNIQRICVKIK